MKAVNVRQLKNNPSEALLVHLDDDSLLAERGIRRSLATALYRDRSLSPGRAARFAGVPLPEFIRYVSRCGIPVVGGTAAEVGTDAEATGAWTQGSSRPTRAR